MLLAGVRLCPSPSPPVCPGAVGIPKAPIPSQGPPHSRLTLDCLILWGALQSSCLVLEVAASTLPVMGRCPWPSAPHPGLRGLGDHPWPSAEPAPGDWRWQCHPGIPWVTKATLR